MTSHPRNWRSLGTRLAAFVAFGLASALALAQAGDPPARVAALSHMEGSVVFAPAGETEWADAPLNRPVTRGDRLWTDKGARAEVHLGSAALQMDSKTFVEVVNLDDDVLQASLREGIVNARVRQLDGGENFELDTPQLAFRATQPGDYRLDVDPTTGTTRVTVRSGAAVVYGTGGGVQNLQAGQQVAYTGRNLDQVAAAVTPDTGFEQWAAARNRSEDQSVTARYVPREVVGYQALDTNGTWSQDVNYGPVWYPRVTVADWAPYRYGHWDWVAPWGWTWIDDAPWGFAPFHYGRWTQIGTRWAWVPGRIGPRPVYAPALVVFVGGTSFSFASGPGVAWFPLAPGEAWRPTYRVSSLYLRNVNRSFVVAGGFNGSYYWQRRPEAITSVRVEDFQRGRVGTNWHRVNPGDIARAPVATLGDLPQPRRWHDANRSANLAVQPRVQAVAPSIINRPWQPAVQAPWQPQQQQQREAQVQQQRQQQWLQQRQQQQAQQQQLAAQQREQQVRHQQQVQQMQQVQRQRDEQVRQYQVQRQQQIQQQQAAQQQWQHRGWQQQQQAAQPQQRHVQPPVATGQPAYAPRGDVRGHQGGGRHDERAAQNDERGQGRGHRYN